MIDTDTWTATDWQRHDAAHRRLCSHKADQFARDLNLCGWKIVPQDPSDGRWICFDGPCPSWADACDDKPIPPKPPNLRLIGGGKPPDDPR